MKTMFLIFLMLLVPTLSFAQQGARPGEDRDSWTFLIAGGPFIFPEFEGATNYRVLPIPFFRASKGNYFIQTEGPGLTANLFNHRKLKFGPSVQYRGERDQDINNSIIQLFETINSTVEAGGFISYRFSLENPGEAITARIKTMIDLGDAHNGYNVSASLSYGRIIGLKTRVNVSLGSTYADQNYNNTYFGVSQTDATLSGFNIYQANSGIKDIGGTINIAHPLSNGWGITGLVGYKKLLSPAANSPIIQNAGTDNQFLGSVALSYRF